MIEELIDYNELVRDGLIKLEFLPHPSVSRCFVARNEGGKIEGYIFSQLLITVEPVWVAEKKRGSSLFLKLFGHIANALLNDGEARYFITHSDNSKMESYWRRLGLEELNWKTFKMELRKVVTGG